MFLQNVNGEIEKEESKNAHNSLLEAAMSILGELILSQFSDAFLQLISCGIKESLRRRVPFLYCGAYETFLDDKRDGILCLFPGNF